MPSWICGSCGATMNVKPSLVGEERPCAKCGVVSVITDANAAESDDAAPVSTPILQRSKGTTLKRMPRDAQPDSDESVGGLAKIILAIAIVVLIGGGAAMGGDPKTAGTSTLWLYGGFSTLILAIVMWPVYTMANDTRANRRLLEQIAKK